jgi:hypothetical protein
MSVEEVKDYIASLQTDALVLGILSLSMKDFASQIISHVLNGGELDDVAFAVLKEKCVRNLKNIEGYGVPIEQEASALNQGLVLFHQMLDEAVANGRHLTY